MSAFGAQTERSREVTVPKQSPVKVQVAALYAVNMSNVQKIPRILVLVSPTSEHGTAR